MLTPDQFTFAVNNCTEQSARHLDKMFCQCGYVSHWVYKMQRGHFNPMLNEMDCELKDVKTPQELYEFLISRL